MMVVCAVRPGHIASLSVRARCGPRLNIVGVARGSDWRQPKHGRPRLLLGLFLRLRRRLDLRLALIGECEALLDHSGLRGLRRVLHLRRLLLLLLTTQGTAAVVVRAGASVDKGVVGRGHLDGEKRGGCSRMCLCLWVGNDRELRACESGEIVLLVARCQEVRESMAFRCPQSHDAHTHTHKTSTNTNKIQQRQREYHINKSE